MTRDDDSAEVLRALVAITRRGLADAEYDGAQLSITDQSIVMAIAQQPGIRSIDIAKMFRLNRSTVSRQIGTLIAVGLVREAQTDAGRGIPLELTPQGIAAFRGTLGSLQTMIDDNLSEWTDEQVARFAHDLARFDRAAQQQ